MKRKHLAIVTSVWPHVEGSFEAANVIVHSIVSQISSINEYDISFFYINSEVSKIPTKALKEIDELKNKGVKFLEPIIVPTPSSLVKNPLKLLKAIIYKPEIILFGYGSGKLILKRTDRKIDAVLTVLSEVAFNAVSEIDTLKFSYHGNPEHKVFNAQYEILKHSGEKTNYIKKVNSFIRRKLLNSILERANLKIARSYTFLTNVANNDALYYKENGVNAFYLANMWPMLPPEDWITIRNKNEVENPGKIIGNVGNLSATGNSLGLITLTKQIIPALKNKNTGNIKIHIYGGRKPRSFIEILLNDPLITVRGFVEDLNKEILSGSIFLISNNNHNFKVGHTRFLHAWSLGACVIAFRDCREAMPEIQHGYNALLGDTAEDIAELIFKALNDQILRRRIGLGGIETLKNSFSPVHVSQRLVENMKHFGM